jgi:hypothetical protein
MARPAQAIFEARVNPSLRRGPTVANHDGKRPEHRRARCLLCKRSKLIANRKAGLAKARREWKRDEDTGGEEYCQAADARHYVDAAAIGSPITSATPAASRSRACNIRSTSA